MVYAVTDRLEIPTLINKSTVTATQLPWVRCLIIAWDDQTGHLACNQQQGRGPLLTILRRLPIKFPFARFQVSARDCIVKMIVLRASG
ncbi:hypothetical protein TNIN_63721 [Trichonephila inaurata madagascariensis]|uniref:Uncharacterized protein n=1 Tax=Trichonephila inaurata madagascariensis TaxID=2747483 RepID=A0A8X7C5L3_9ARAC|nr:hypothetical protein TNIN_63721 [Trichonephila inaurata madagascariensis]